jgi:hypothetical protein
MPSPSKVGSATRQTLTYCISSHCSRAFSMSPTCAHCLPCVSASRPPNQVVSIRMAHLCTLYSNLHCTIDVACQAVGFGCSERRYPRCYSFTDHSLQSFMSSQSTFCYVTNPSYLLLLSSTRHSPLTGCPWSSHSAPPLGQTRELKNNCDSLLAKALKTSSLCTEG